MDLLSVSEILQTDGTRRAFLIAELELSKQGSFGTGLVRPPELLGSDSILGVTLAAAVTIGVERVSQNSNLKLVYVIHTRPFVSALA